MNLALVLNCFTSQHISDFHQLHSWEMSPSLPWWPPPGQLQLPHISLLWLPFILHSSWWTGFQRTQLLFVIRTHCECFTLTYWDSGLISLTILAFLSCIMPGWFLPWGLHINLEMYQCLSFIALTQASSHSCLPCKLYIKIGFKTAISKGCVLLIKKIKSIRLFKKQP